MASEQDSSWAMHIFLIIPRKWKFTNLFLEWNGLLQDLPDDERERGLSPGISVELVDSDAAAEQPARTVIPIISIQ